jgi:hypothetical protein
MAGSMVVDHHLAHGGNVVTMHEDFAVRSLPGT